MDLEHKEELNNLKGLINEVLSILNARTSIKNVGING
jgi:hypothetical protein